MRNSNDWVNENKEEEYLKKIRDNLNVNCYGLHLKMDRKDDDMKKTNQKLSINERNQLKSLSNF